MSEPGNKKEMSPQLRILAASLLSMAVILMWTKFFGPKQPVNAPQPSKPAISAPAPANPSAGPSGQASASPSTKATKNAAPAPAIATTGDTQERTTVIENSLYHVEISNRGAVVKSWQLKKYMDDAKPPRVLDLVHAEAAKQVGGWPFALVMDDEQAEQAVNAGLFVSSVAGSSLQAPGEAVFSWSDGHLEVTKRFQFDHSYVVRVETSVKLNGAPVKAGLAWLGGFGDLTVTNPVPIETVNTFYSESGKLTSLPYKKLDGPEKWKGIWQGGKDWVGIEDRYFAAAMLPANGAATGTLETRYWKTSRTIPASPPTTTEETQEPVPQVAVATQTEPMAVRVYVGPKDYDQLKRMTPPLHSLIQFGWFEFIADPLFHALKWLHSYIPNWGWAIVVLTLLLNMLLLPLRISSYKSMVKMQRVAPEIKAIQDRYKKYTMRDPRKQEMNKEVMAVYQREGINPVGGCVPQLLQFPIWLGLYRALQGTIEMRHAPWFGWIKDLSAKDPYFILPILMGASMYLATKMTPMTTTDPQQQMMMKIMPIGIAATFVVIPYPSGLAVYILTSSLVGIAQQWYLNKTHPPATAPAKAARGKKS